MNSGIYKLTFADGSIYIGKSVDITKRWGQHTKAFNKGTHTKKLQDAFSLYGMPKFEVIFECHPHHIDILETYFINAYWSDSILNSTRPADIEEDGHDVLEQFPDFVWDMSTFEHLLTWNTVKNRLVELEDKIKNSHDAKYLDRLLEKNERLGNELTKLKNRGFWARVFNWQE